jgi:hypothetical protein
VLEAVVTGAVNTRHAAYLSAKAGLSRVASYEYSSLLVKVWKLITLPLMLLARASKKNSSVHVKLRAEKRSK